jgi:hypothetical protein
MFLNFLNNVSSFVSIRVGNLTIIDEIDDNEMQPITLGPSDNNALSRASYVFPNNNLTVSSTNNIVNLKMSLKMTPGPIMIIILKSNKPKDYGIILSLQTDNNNINIKISNSSQWTIPNTLITDDITHRIQVIIQNITVTTYIDSIKVDTHTLPRSIYEGASFTLSGVGLGKNFGYGMNGGIQTYSKIKCEVF